MADTGKQSPLGVNVLGSILSNTGLNINPVAAAHMGSSKTNSDYIFGSVVQNTVLRLLTWAINDGYLRGPGNSNATLSDATYNNLISIGTHTGWYAVTNPVWSSFMNTYAVWTGGEFDVTTNVYSKDIVFPVTGDYAFQVSADDTLNVYLDGVLVVASSDVPSDPNYPADKTVQKTITAGTHTLYFTIWNGWGPAGAAIQISKPDTTALWNTREIISESVSTIPALGNAKPPTYVVNDPSGTWTTLAVASGGGLPGPATSGYSVTSNVDQGQQATWIPYDTTNPNKSITQWGYVRLHALQAWYEFNWNGAVGSTAIVQYKDFCSSFMTANGFINYSNQAINAINASDTFLEGVYSNMDDLISADIAGVNLSTTDFGTDLINLGKTINLKNIATFGLPSNLLQTLGKNSAITQDLSLALLASGLSSAEISSISAGTASSITIPQEQQIYGAFLIITGTNLANVLAPLQCSTSGFTSLADLLNVQKLFPISYSSLTVPVYNGAPGLPTNSKTYYLIYSNGGLNNTLDSPAIREYVGVQLPSGNPQIFNNSVSPNNFRELPKGFGSYLKDVIPPSQAIAAGAFSYSMRQIRNIEYCNFQKFAKVVKGIETTNDLSQVNGTSKPTDQTLLNYGSAVTALGSGPYGAYTFSDMFGSMSGLPYPWKLMQDRINQLTTSTLSNIYRDLFLAVTWESATVSVQYTSYQVETSPGPPPTYTIYYHVTGVTVTQDGGGYGRGSAVAPTITINGGSGATATCTIGTTDSNAGSNGAGTFGRVTSASLTSSGTDTTTIPTITIQCPPITTAGATNTPSGTTGWASPMNDVVQSYIDQANAEIANIQRTNVDAATHLNVYWNVCGTQLKVEQRTRYIGITPVPVPKDYFMNSLTSSLYAFVDSVPSLSQDTKPHMSAQTLEAISDLLSSGGQSTVAMMRQERNQARLQTIGISLDNNMPDTLNVSALKTLTTNGTLPGAKEGIASPNGNMYTIPAWPENETAPCVNPPSEPMITTLTPQPGGTYVPAEKIITSATNPSTVLVTFPDRGICALPIPAIIAVTNPSDTSSITPIIAGYQPGSDTKPGDITPIITGDPNPVVNPLVPTGPASGPGISGIGGTGISGTSGTSGTGIGPAGNSSISTGTGTGVANHIVIIGVPSGLNVNNLPPNLDPNYTSSTLFPATPSIAQAIEQVIACNCDCWV